MYKPIWPGTYYFKSFTFTSMGNSGHRGPTSNQTYADAPWPSPSYFSIKNGQQNWTVPANGVYQITAAGAYGATPGRVVTGQATLSEGQVLTMLVGQQPTPLTANVLDNVTVGGAGGTFVTTNGTPLIVASGGDGSGSTSSPGSFSPPGNGGGGSGAGYYGNGSGTNPFFQFLVPYSYVNGGYGNSYEYGQPTLTENGGFGGGQSPIGLLTPITQITGDGSFATCTTSVPHGYPFNYIVNISGTTYYDGVQTIQVLDPSTFVFASSNTETVSSGTVSGLVTGSSGGGGYTGSPGDGTQGATCYADPSVQNFTDLGANSNASGYVTISLVNPVPLVQSPTWNKTWTTTVDTFVPANSKASATAFGNGTYVAVTNNGTDPVLYSYDGVNWLRDAIGVVVAPWVSVTYGNSLFVAVSSDARRMISSDGIHWTLEVPVPSVHWNSVAYGNGLFVAVGLSSPYVMTSPDGINWTGQTAPVSDWISVTYGNGLFVAVSYASSPTVMTSPDGINWTTQTAPGGYRYSITDGNGLFVAVGASSPTVMASPDGINWTAQTASYGSWISVTYGNGLFVAVSPNSPYVKTSPDGFNWTVQTAPTGQWQTVTYGNGLFVAVGLSSPYVMTSPDGINWTVQTVPGTWVSVTYGNGLFVAVASYSVRSVMTSPDGINWTGQTAPGSGWTSVTYGNGLFVAVSSLSSPVVMTSPDGINWSVAGRPLHNYSSVTYGNGLFVTVTNNTSSSAANDYSSDGVYWFHGKLPIDSWSAVSYGNGVFSALTNMGSNVYAYSSDGITWYTSAAALLDSWTASTYGGNGLFAAVSSNGLTMYSQTGTSWIEGGSLGVSSNAITYGQGYFVAPSSNASIANVMISTDCLTWSNVSISTAAAYSGATYGSPYGFIIVSLSTFEIGLTPTFFANSNQVISTKKLNFASWSQVTYGNGTFVAGGQGLLQNTVDGGQTWSRTSVSNTVASVTYSRDLGTFLAFGNVFVDGTYTSQDGATWIQNTNVPLTVPSANVSTVWGRDKFVAVLDGDSNVLYSRDGVYWSVTTQGTVKDSWKSITYGNGKFVACSSSSALVSFDGVSWTPRSILFPKPPDGYWTSVTYGNGLFVAVAQYSNPIVMTSPDGITWTGQTAPFAYWTSVTYGNGLFVAVALYSGPYVMTSPDGINWTAQTAPGSGWTSVTYGNGLFVVVSAFGGVMTSPDGINWTGQTAPVSDWISVTYGNGLFVAVSYAGYPYVMTSPDGINWTTQTAPDGYRYSITYGNGLFVAVGASSPTVMASPDGINWTAQTVPGTWVSVTYGNGLFVAVGGAQPTLMVSTDGIIWNYFIGATLTSITYGNGVYVAVASGDREYYSFDGLTWTSSPFAPMDAWVSVVYGNGYFMATSKNGTHPVMYSQDGIHWYTDVSGAQAIDWLSIAYGNNEFLAIDSVGGSTMTTTLGETF